MNSAKLKAVKKVGKAQARQAALAAAMPEVRALCEKHGRSIVSSCLTRITKYEKKSAEVERLRKEAAALEQKLLSENGNAIAV